MFFLEKHIFREKVSKHLKKNLDCCIQSSAIIHFFCHNTLDDALNFHFVGINHSEGSKVGATILNLKQKIDLIEHQKSRPLVLVLQLEMSFPKFGATQRNIGNALGISICGCRCILESSGSQNRGCTYYQKPQNQRVQKVMSQRSAGLCTRCTRANAFPVIHDLGVILYQINQNVCDFTF